MKVTFRVHGADKLANKLAKLSDAARGKALERALTAGALVIANEAKRKVPYRTGTLRRSIHVGGHTGLTPDFAGEARDIGGNKSNESTATVLVGTDVKYAAQVEFGGTIKAKHAPFLVFRTSDGRLVRVKSVTQRARPYMRPALDSKAAAAQREVSAALKVLVDKAVR